MSLRILWLNWRDIKHPLAGGAEVYTHEVARRLTAKGHEVVLVTSRPPGLPPEEEIEGYRVIRRGGKYTVYLQARRLYHKLRERGWRPDIVIDEINTIPFLTPLYVEEPITILIHQLCRDCWRYAIHPLAQPPGWLIEKILHRLYTRAARKDKVRAVITVSESTKKDLVELGYPEHLVTIAYNALDWRKYRQCPELAKEKEDLVVYVGRITPYKRLQDLLYAWQTVEQEHPGARLVIAGRPDQKYLERLRRLANRLGLRRTTIHTNISHEEKLRLLARAKTLVYTSTREGWGQTILEAAACQTPAIAYNVPGLRDAVKHMETGILVRPGDAKRLAETITTILEDDDLREELAINAYKRAQRFTWDNTATKILETINKILA